MPTKLPRMGLSLTPELHASLMKLSKASGTSASVFVVEMLSTALPAIEALTTALEMAKIDPAQGLALAVRNMVQVQADVNQEQLLFLDNLKTLRAARGAGRRSRKKKEAPPA